MLERGDVVETSLKRVQKTARCRRKTFGWFQGGVGEEGSRSNSILNIAQAERKKMKRKESTGKLQRKGVLRLCLVRSISDRGGVVKKCLNSTPSAARETKCERLAGTRRGLPAVTRDFSVQKHTLRRKKDRVHGLLRKS